MNFKKILSFLNLLDNQQNLSITNVAVLITLAKLVIAPSSSLTEAGMLLISLANYGHKRVVTNKSKEQEINIESKIDTALSDTKNQIEKMQSSVNSLLIKSGFKL